MPTFIYGHPGVKTLHLAIGTINRHHQYVDVPSTAVMPIRYRAPCRDEPDASSVRAGIPGPHGFFPCRAWAPDLHSNNQECQECGQGGTLSVVRKVMDVLQ